MLKWGTCAFGALLAIWGLWWGITGYSVVEVERGWSGVIAGASVFASGAVVLAIAALMFKLDALMADWQNQAAARAEVQQESVARLKTEPARPSVPVMAQPIQLGKVEPAAEPPQTASGSLPAITAVTATAIVAAVAVAAGTKAVHGEDPQVIPEPDAEPGRARRASPELKVVEGGSAKTNEAASEADALAQVKALEDKIQADNAATAPDSAKETGQEIGQDTGIQSELKRATIPVPPLVSAPVHADWPEAPVIVSATPEPRLTIRPPVARLPQMPRAIEPAPMMAETAVPSEATMPVPDHTDAEIAGASSESAAPVATSERMSAETLAIEARPLWVNQLFDELDQMSVPGQKEAPSVPAVAEPVVEAEIAAAPELPAAEIVEAATPAAEPESATGVPPAIIEPAVAPERKLVRSYDSQGVTYHLYDDGSIDAQTSGGTFQFASLEELRAFIEKRSA